MSQRYRKSVAAVMTSEPENSSSYQTRNKRRKLDEIQTSPTIPRLPQSVVTPSTSQIPRKPVETIQPRHSLIYSRNLDKALKSILSESPKMKNSKAGGGDNIRQRIEFTPSADDEASSSVIVPGRGNGQASSVSFSSQSRETTPSSLGVAIVDIPPIIRFFQKERENGRISKEVRAEALKMLREWHSEWYVVDKRVRELKRKIKAHNAIHAERSSPTASTPVKERGSLSSKEPIDESTKSVDLSQTVPVGEPETPIEGNPERSQSPTRSRRSSVAGPNGLTGAYWNVAVSEMGRGNRRKTKT